MAEFRKNIKNIPKEFPMNWVCRYCTLYYANKHYKYSTAKLKLRYSKKTTKIQLCSIFYLTMLIKGQIISECLFDVFQFSKKNNKKFEKFLPKYLKSGQVIK